MTSSEGEEPIKQLWLWVETGDLLSFAYVYKRRAWYTVESPCIFLENRYPKSKGFRNKEEAFAFARELVDEMLQESITFWVKEFGNPLPGEKSIESAFSIQEVENDSR